MKRKNQLMFKVWKQISYPFGEICALIKQTKEEKRVESKAQEANEAQAVKDQQESCK